ncbi:hypothetical protein H1Q78_04025 [Cellulosimicrobium cellulans]|uniref:hypothetical protein n=1 Tax=Cellulosimicrobium cellulans TaxID=1710 RepID=UPI001EDB86AE|nr:hypothetical protein [Cellulosimicrobium cellulans]UKJ64596.1 hypothetical protein H1Q78_04025 [Cellulosimicrobium cellulans]
MARALRTLAAAGVAAVVTATARRAAGSRPPGGAGRWTRTNHRGEPISLLEGPAVAAGLVAGTLAAGGDARTRGAVALATASAGAFGLVDDLAEDTSTRTKGLRGHLGALAEGRVTTGAMKILGISGVSLVAAAIGTRRTGGAFGHLVDVGVNGALMAGTANLLNLLDLRPGRALKAAGAASLPYLGTSAAPTTGAVLGAAVAAAPGDLGERDMLGDCGANALGAALGSQVAFAAPRAVRWLALAGVVGLTLASEKVSFSKVIEGNDALRRVDAWGRRPA